MKKIKPAIALLTIFFIFSAFYFGFRKFNRPYLNKVIKEKIVTVSLKIENQELGKINTTKINALELLKEKAKVITKGEGVNAYVISINGKETKSENKEFWAFYINGKQAEVGVGSYELKNGDKIEWKIEKY